MPDAPTAPAPPPAVRDALRAHPAAAGSVDGASGYSAVCAASTVLLWRHADGPRAQVHALQLPYSPSGQRFLHVLRQVGRPPLQATRIRRELATPEP